MTTDSNTLYLVKHTFIDNRGNVFHARQKPYEAHELPAYILSNTEIINLYVVQEVNQQKPWEPEGVVVEINNTSNDIKVVNESVTEQTKKKKPNIEEVETKSN